MLSWKEQGTLAGRASMFQMREHVHIQTAWLVASTAIETGGSLGADFK